MGAVVGEVGGAGDSPESGGPAGHFDTSAKDATTNPEGVTRPAEAIIGAAGDLDDSQGSDSGTTGDFDTEAGDVTSNPEGITGPAGAVIGETGDLGGFPGSVGESAGDCGTGAGGVTGNPRGVVGPEGCGSGGAGGVFGVEEVEAGCGGCRARGRGRSCHRRGLRREDAVPSRHIGIKDGALHEG
ncbi:hypothetical protein [Nonomuraea dietziae]|uniref:hypothetical protein n=1 Tax=Nonomuraea dietziae TaxID=65515 RepID=UPI00341C5571